MAAIPIPWTVLPPPPYVFTDDFNRANGPLGSNWDTTSAGAIEIVSNQASVNTGGGTGEVTVSTATHTWVTSNRYAQLKISQWNNDPIQLTLASGTVYARFATSVSIRIYGTTGFNSGVTPALNDVIKISVIGTDVYLYQNGSQVWTTTLSVPTPLTGQPGFGFQSQSSPGNPAIDDFEAGEL